MMNRTFLASLLVVCWAMPSSAGASDEENVSSEPQQPVAVAQPVPKKQDLSSWWEKSSMEYQSVPAQWLFHGAGTLSYMNASGNTSGSTFDVTANADIRKSRFTSHSFAQLSRKDMVYGFTQSSVNYTERTLREQVDYDVTARIKVLAGVEHYRNTLMFMDKRLNVYGGMGATLYRDKKHQLALTGGVGHADFTFDRAQMLRVNPREVGVMDTSPSSGGGIAMQAWQWKASPRFVFSEDASYMKYFDAYLGCRWTINLNGNVPIDKRFSFVVTYRVKEETNAIIKALRVHPQDRTFLIGVRVSI